MREKWLNLVTLFEKHTLREKMLFSACVLAGIYGIWFFVVENTLVKRQQELSQRFNALTLATEKTTKIQQLFSDASLNNPNIEKKKEIKELERRLLNLDRELEALSVGLVPAFDLPNVLRDVLNSNKKMRLIGLTSLPPQELNLHDLSFNTKNHTNEIDDERGPAEIMYDDFQRAIKQNMIRQSTVKKNIKSEPSLNNVGVFKHSVVVQVEGSYFDVIDYLSILENLSWKFYWSELDYRVVDHPKAIVTLEVYTLSTGAGVSRG